MKKELEHDEGFKVRWRQAFYQTKMRVIRGNLRLKEVEREGEYRRRFKRKDRYGRKDFQSRNKDTGS